MKPQHEVYVITVAGGSARWLSPTADPSGPGICIMDPRAPGPDRSPADTAAWVLEALTACRGMESPMAEVSRLKEVEASVLASFEDPSQEDLTGTPGPWVICDQPQAPMLFWTGFAWAGKAEAAALVFDPEVALETAERQQGYAIPARRVA